MSKSSLPVREDLRFIAWPDTHVPNQDERAVEVALQITAWYKPHTIIILGDFVDNEPVAHWLQHKRMRKEGLRLAKDYDAANKLLNRITKYCKRLVYIAGNHERFLQDALELNPEFDGLINLDIGLKFAERRQKGLELIYKENYGECWNLGKLWFTHGTFVGGHHAQKHVDSFGRSIVYGHTHTYQSHTRVSPIDVDDKHIGISLGCLAAKNPKYMENKPNAWVHCVGVGLSRPDGTFNIDPVVISEGVASYAGKTFRV